MNNMFRTNGIEVHQTHDYFGCLKSVGSQT